MFDPTDGDDDDDKSPKKVPPLPSLEVIRQGRQSQSLRAAIRELLFFHDQGDGPLYGNPQYKALIQAPTNELCVTKMKSGDTWKATFMLVEYAREQGARFSAIYDAESETKVRNVMNDVLRKAGAGRDRQMAAE